MIEFIKKHSKLYMILSMCILVATIGITYAFYSATVTDNTKVVGEAGGGALPTLTISKITTDSGKLIPIDMDTTTLTKAASANPKCIDKNGHTACQIYSVTVTNNTDVGQSFNVELTSLAGTNTPNVDAVSMGTSNSSVANATSIKDNGLICTTNRVNKGETTNTCYFMVLIKNINSAQTDNGIFSGTVTITSTTGAELKADFSNGEKLTTTISNLYNNASKTSVNAEDGLTYNYASSVSLMNDRLANSTVGIDAGNIRYYGASPDNYVDIGDVYEEDTIVKNWIEPMKQLGLADTQIPTDTAGCKYMAQCSILTGAGFFPDVGTCEVQLPYMLQQFGYTTTDELCSETNVPAGTTKSLYRIIGLFKNVELSNGTTKDLVKVVKATTLGRYSWDQSPSNINEGYGINEWNQADLMKLLNPGYEKETTGGSLYWNSGSGSCYSYDSNTDTYISVPCDFTNNGLSTIAKTKIESVKWNLGGWNNYVIFANQIYEYERQGNLVQNPSDGITRQPTWNGRVALAYPSDYGYAVDLSSCRDTLNNYENCIATNWMYNPMTANGAMWSWLLTPISSNAKSAWFVDSDGTVCGASGVNTSGGVSPVFYLDSELVIETGNGSSGQPYVVG